jgi:hypothetical protein
MAEPVGYSKREVSRAGRHLAGRLAAARGGDREATIDPTDVDDIHARDVVEWWRSEHVGPMLDVAETVEVADIGGVRAVVNSQDESDDVAARLGKVLDVHRVRDWVRTPRSTGYRAIHLHVRQRGQLIEVQLRTFGQDAWANVVEEESRLSGVNYKAGQGDADVLQLFSCIADGFAAFELGEGDEDTWRRLHEAFVVAQPKLRTPILRDLRP